MSGYLIHYGISGQKHGVRRYQNYDGSLTPAGKRRYHIGDTMQGPENPIAQWNNHLEQIQNNINTLATQDASINASNQAQAESIAAATGIPQTYAVQNTAGAYAQEVQNYYASRPHVKRKTGEGHKIQAGLHRELPTTGLQNHINDVQNGLHAKPKENKPKPSTPINKPLNQTHSKPTTSNFLSTIQHHAQTAISSISNSLNYLSSWFKNHLKHDGFETVYLSDIDNYLSHHGIQNQKWGVRNGPPYPLNAEGKAAFREQRKKERAEKKADRKYVRDTKKYMKNLESKRQIEERRSTNYQQYASTNFSKKIGVGAAATAGAFTAGVNKGGGLNEGLLAGGITLGLSTALAAVNTAKKVNKQRKIDDIKYNKLNNKLFDYEHKYGKTRLSSINDRINNKPQVNRDHELLYKDPAQMSGKELAIATKRKEAEARYANISKRDSYGAQLGKDVLRSFAVSAAGSAGNAIVSKVAGKEHKKSKRS